MPGWKLFSQGERLSVQRGRRLNRDWVDERLERKAGLLAHLDQVADLIWRLAGLDLNESFETESAASQGALERRTFHEESRDLLKPDRLDIKLCDGPEPGQLGEHSEGDAGAEVSERRRGHVFPRQISTLVADDRERAAFGLLERHDRPLLHSRDTLRLDRDPQLAILVRL